MDHTDPSIEPSIVQNLLAAAAPPEILQVVLDAAIGRLAADRCAVALYSEGELETIATTGDTALAGPSPGDELGLDHQSLVYHDRDSCLVEDLSDTRRSTVESPSGTGPERQDGVRSLLCVPLGKVGILRAEATTTNAFTEHDRSWLEQLAAYASSALERFQLQRFETAQATTATSRSTNGQSDAGQEPADPEDWVTFVLNATGTVLWQVDTDDRSLRMYGPVDRAYDITPGQRQDLQMFIDEYIHPEDRSRVRCNLEAVFQGEVDEVTVQYRMQATEHDETRWFKGRAALTDDGVLIGISTHITDQKRREWKIKSLQQRIAGLIRADSPEEVARVAVDTASEAFDLPMSGVHFYDGDSTLEPTAVSEAVTEEFDCEPVYRKASDDPVDSFVWEAFESGDAKIVEDTSEHGQLVETPVGSSIVHPLDEYGVIITSALEPNAFDETDIALGEVLTASTIAALDRADQEQRLRQQAAELERKNERLEEFTSIVSHDLRNPLNVALGRVEYLQNREGGEHLETAERALERMAAIIDETLALARQGERVDSREPVALGEMVEQCWQNVETADATLQNGFDDGTGPTVQADKERLAHVFENLFANAIEHGGPDVTIQIGCLNGDRIYVEDDGPGIPEDERENVFDIGYTTSEDGTGFGLPLVEDIVEAHDWSVTITDSRMGGTRFEITGLDRA